MITKLRNPKALWAALLLAASCSAQDRATDTEAKSSVMATLGLSLPTVPVAIPPSPIFKVPPRPPANLWLAALRARPDIVALPAGQRAELDRLFTASRARVDVAVRPVTGAATRLRGDFATTDKDPHLAAASFLSQFAAGFGLNVGQLRVTAQEPTALGTRVRFDQYLDGVPVFGSGATVTVRSDGGSIVDVCSQSSNPSDVPIKPSVSASAAAEVAAGAVGVDDPAKLGKGRLVVFDGATLTVDSSPRSRLAWLFEVQGSEGTARAFVDAAEGTLLLPYFATASDDAAAHECPSTPMPYYYRGDASDTPDFVTFTGGGYWLPEAGTGDPVQVALAFFRARPLVYGTGDVPNQLAVKTVDRETAAPFATHVVLQQMYGGLPVYGAELRVHLDAGLSITSINGRYIRDPRVVPVAPVSEAAAAGTAIQALRNVRAAQGVSYDPAPELKSLGLHVYPRVLAGGGAAAHNAVSWRFQFQDAEVFVGDASNEAVGQVVAMLPLRAGVDRHVYDAGGASQLSFPLLVQNNGMPSSGSLTADAAVADPLMSATVGFFDRLGRNSFDNQGSPIVTVTNTNLALTGGCGGAQWDPVRGWMWFCPGNVVGDVMGHEFTHGVSWSTAHFLPIDEAGALNEHYSDVMGVLAFPDAAPGVWRLGEGRPGGGFRDLVNQAPAGYWAFVPRGPGCTAPEDVFKPVCDAGRVHTNCAIGNHAAVFLADGDNVAGSPHPGIGRDRLAKLFLETLTRRMHPYSTYLDERLNTWQMARDLAASGTRVVDSTTPNNFLFFDGVSDQVGWAFTQVGVDPRLIAGWFNVPVGVAGGRGTLTFFDHQTMPACTVVSDIVLQVRVFDPFGLAQPWWTGSSNLSGPSGGMVAFPGGILGASIIDSHVGTNDKSTTVRFFHSGFLSLDINVSIIAGKDPACSTPNAGNPNIPPPVSEVVTAGPTHWATFSGGKGDDTLNAFGFMREPNMGKTCTITAAFVEMLNQDGSIFGSSSLGSPPVIRPYYYNTLTTGVQLTKAMLGTSSPPVQVHWWFDVGSAARYQVRYFAEGNGCSIQ